jgi:hypothetical protein
VKYYAGGAGLNWSFLDLKLDVELGAYLNWSLKLELELGVYLNWSLKLELELEV